MIDRNKLILARARELTGKLNQTDITDDELIDIANQVQRSIFSSGDIEKSFVIYLKKDKEAYDFRHEEALIIKSLHPSWTGGKIRRVADRNWDDYRNATGEYPAWYTIFDRKIYFSPVPISSNDTVEVWAYQTALIVPMDDEVPPELDETFDTVLAYGIAAKLKPDLFEEYLGLLNRQLSNVSQKAEELEPPDFNW